MTGTPILYIYLANFGGDSLEITNDETSLRELL